VTVVVVGAPSTSGAVGVNRAPDEAFDAGGAFDKDEEALLARATPYKNSGAWTESCCTLVTTPIITPLISVHTTHKELRFCLEEVTGEGLVLLL
jgi:hypothetical protein